MEHRVLLASVLASLIGCGGTADKASDTPATTTLVDRLVEVGTWVDDARYVGRLVSSGCNDCAEVFLYRYERHGTGLRLSIELYYDKAPAGHTDGELVCTAVMDVDVLDVPGPDPTGRVFLQEALVQAPTCFGQPALATQTEAVVDGEALANWQTRIPDEKFPGWFIDGGRAYRVVPCPEGSRAEGRPYCRPTCDAGSGGQGACRYAASPADSAPEKPVAGCDFVAGWNAIDVAGSRRDFYLAKPRAPDPTRKLPLAFVWHGGGGDPLSELDVSGVGLHAVNGEALALAPVAIDNEALPVWDDFGEDSPDLALYDALHACLPALNADPDRVISTGMSAGGFFTANLLLRRADQLASGAVFSGGMRPMWQPTSSHPAALLVWGGDPDTSACAKPDGSVGGCSYSEEIASMASNLEENGQKVILCDHGGGHIYPDTGPTLVWDLMMASVRGSAPFAGGLPAGWPSYCRVAK